MSKTVVVGTWAFSEKPVLVTGRMLKEDRSTCVEAVQQGINVAEDDEHYGQYVVGRGGPRNREGLLELDAAIMDGRDLSFGAVTALQGVPTAVSVAADVMKHSDHSFLTGSGAAEFASKRGYHIEPELLAKVVTAQEQNPQGPKGYDTLGLIALSQDNICAGVSTSGMPGKMLGRVGDSALPGCGLYADTDGGAACCSGDGDEILKFCPCFHTVLLMKQGLTAQDATDNVMTDILRKLGKKEPFEIALLAVDMKGNVGASTTKHEGFPFIEYRDGDEKPQLRMREPLS